MYDSFGDCIHSVYSLYRPVFFLTLVLVTAGVLYLFAGGRGDIPIVIRYSIIHNIR
jgi:hypothetical protein